MGYTSAETGPYADTHNTIQQDKWPVTIIGSAEKTELISGTINKSTAGWPVYNEISK
jgi:hypothetical protein